MTLPGVSRRDTFTVSLMPWWAAAAIGEDSERTSEVGMGRLPATFDPYADIETMRSFDANGAPALEE